MTQLNDQLDEIIFSTSGRESSMPLSANFRDFIFRYRKVLLTCMEYAAISLSEHEEIVRAMKEGDGERVEKLVRKHLLRGRDILIKDMESGKEM